MSGAGYSYFPTRFAWPFDFAKKQNYLIVDDCAGQTHFLDRYADRPVTLCGRDAQTTEIEWDPMGYQSGVDCSDCRAEVERRVLA